MLAEQLKNNNPTDESWAATSRNPERGRGRDGNPPPEDGKPHKQTKIRRNYNDYNV